MRRCLPSRSMVVALLALSVATAGSASAASYVITKSSQIKPSVRKALKGQRGAQGLRGDRGPQGPQGFTGPAGAAGPAGLSNLTTTDGPEKFYTGSGSGSVVSASATCPAGQQVLSGGFRAGPSGGTSLNPTVVWSQPVGTNGWSFIVVNNDPGSGDSIIPTVRCGSVAGAPASARAADATRAERDALLAALRAARDRKTERAAG